MEIPGLSFAPIIFIVLIIVPGVFAKRFYFLGEFSKQFGAGLFADRIITSIFWGFIVQICTFIPYSAYFKFTFSEVANSSIKVYKDMSDGKFPTELEKYDPWMMLGYIVALIGMSALMGIIAHTAIRKTGLDTRYRVFQFANHWHYYFTGEILKTSSFKDKRKKVISTSADVVMDGGDQKPKMFSGILSQYTISGKTGELETIILTEVRKYSDKEKGFKEVPSDFMVIPYNKIIDLNIRYESPEEEEKQKEGKQSGIVTAFINIFVVLSFAMVFIAPWFFGQSFLRTAAAIICLAWAWLFGSIIVSYMFDKQQREKLKDTPWWLTIILFFTGLFMSAVLLKIAPSLTSYYEWLIPH